MRSKIDKFNTVESGGSEAHSTKPVIVKVADQNDRPDTDSSLAVKDKLNG